MQYKRKLSNESHQVFKMDEDQIINILCIGKGRRVLERFKPNKLQREKFAAICAMSVNGWVN